MTVGVCVGAILAALTPSTGLFARDRARALLRQDTARALTTVASLADDGDPRLFAVGALAHTLLAVEHAGGVRDRLRAQGLLQTTVASVRTAPEALYARTLLARTGVEDPSLTADLASKSEKSKSPFALLARATLAIDAGNHDEAQSLLERAALGPRAPLQAQTQLARLLVGRGQLGDARAIAERARRSAPDHAQSRVIGVLAAVLDDLREETAEERAVKLKKLRKSARKDAPGPQTDGLAPRDEDETARFLALWRTLEEEEAIQALDGIEERDRALVALFLQALAAARGDAELAASLRGRVTAAAKRHPGIAARQMELSLLEGDTATAAEVFSAIETAIDKGLEPTLALQQARLSALLLLPEDERRKRASGPRALKTSGAVLPFGELAFDLSAPSLPFVARFDPVAVPEAALFAAMRSGATGSTLQQKLDTALLIHKGDSALLRGDLAGASEAAALAKTTSPSDTEVLFLDARIRLRQNDRTAARNAIDAAIAAAPNDPHVLLVGARLHYDNEGFIPARKTLRKLFGLGLKSPAALSLDAMLDARAGDARSAQASLAAARAIGADDTAILRANLLILREGRDLEAARAAATKLHDVDQLRTTDPILRAWQADALARTGDKGRAAAVLEEVVVQRNLGDAHFFLAELTGDPASYAKAAKLAPGTVIALEATKKRSPTARKKKPGR